jgi:hypothetical protein
MLSTATYTVEELAEARAQLLQNAPASNHAREVFFRLNGLGFDRLRPGEKDKIYPRKARALIQMFSSTRTKDWVRNHLDRGGPKLTDFRLPFASAK